MGSLHVFADDAPQFAHGDEHLCHRGGADAHSFVAFFAEQDNFAVDNRRAVTVDDAPGFSVDLVSAEDDAPFAGRIVMAQPTDDRLFVMTGVAPLAKWEEGEKTLAPSLDLVGKI